MTTSQQAPSWATIARCAPPSLDPESDGTKVATPRHDTAWWHSGPRGEAPSQTANFNNRAANSYKPSVPLAAITYRGRPQKEALSSFEKDSFRKDGLVGRNNRSPPAIRPCSDPSQRPADATEALKASETPGSSKLVDSPKKDASESCMIQGQGLNIAEHEASPHQDAVSCMSGSTHKYSSNEATDLIGSDAVVQDVDMSAAVDEPMAKRVTTNLHQPQSIQIRPQPRSTTSSSSDQSTNITLSFAEKAKESTLKTNMSPSNCEKRTAPAKSNAYNYTNQWYSTKTTNSPACSTLVNSMQIKTLTINASSSDKKQHPVPSTKPSNQAPALSKAQKKRRGRKAKNEKNKELGEPLPETPTENVQSVPQTKPQAVVEKDTNNGTTLTTYPRGHLLALPDEMLSMILRECLLSTVPSGIPIDPMFDPSPPHSPCMLDYRVIHACRRLYDLGIEQMYEVNKWAIDLRAFHEYPKLYEQWPVGFGIDIGMRRIRHVVLMNDVAGTCMWDHAIRCLKGFDEHGGINLPRGGRKCLTKLTFDVRPRARRALQGWYEEPAPERIVRVLKRAGLMGQDMLKEGVWIAAASKEDAEYQRNLPDDGFGGLCTGFERSFELWKASQGIAG